MQRTVPAIRASLIDGQRLARDLAQWSQPCRLIQAADLGGIPDRISGAKWYERKLTIVPRSIGRLVCAVRTQISTFAEYSSAEGRLA